MPCVLDMIIAGWLVRGGRGQPRPLRPCLYPRPALRPRPFWMADPKVERRRCVRRSRTVDTKPVGHPYPTSESLAFSRALSSSSSTSPYPMATETSKTPLELTFLVAKWGLQHAGALHTTAQSFRSCRPKHPGVGGSGIDFGKVKISQNPTSSPTLSVNPIQSKARSPRVRP